MDELISIDDRVWALIDRYDLHGTPDNPVDLVNLSRLENEFPLVVEDLSAMEVAGYVIPPHGDISPNNTSPIFVHRTLGPIARRLTYAHEIGHALHGHAGALSLASMDEWFMDRVERDAWIVAAQLLVPVDTMARYETIDAIAAVCMVPRKLVELA